MATPTPYENWRVDPFRRQEDAASNFGFYLMTHCRAEALKIAESRAAPATKAEFNAAVAEAVDEALHNVADILEGLFATSAGPKHRTEFALTVCVRDESGEIVERVDVSPGLIDLPIGYWAWKEDFASS